MGNWLQERLGHAMAANLARPSKGVEVLHWDAIDTLAQPPVEQR